MIPFLLAASDTTSTRWRKLVLSTAFGPAFNPGPMGVPSYLETKVEPWGVAATGRLMWHPEHLLRVGIESGWSTLYSYSINDPLAEGSVQLTAVPLMLQLSMPFAKRFEIFAGFGTYRLTSRLEYLGTVRSVFFSQGYSAALAYKLPLHDRIHMAFEFKWMNPFVTGHHLLALQWRMDLDLHKW